MLDITEPNWRTLLDERTEWTDLALDREFIRVYKQINGTPERMVRLEEAIKVLGNQMQDLVEENEKLRKEIRGVEWTRTQIIGALGVLAAFAGSAAAVASVVFA